MPEIHAISGRGDKLHGSSDRGGSLGGKGGSIERREACQPCFCARWYVSMRYIKGSGVLDMAVMMLRSMFDLCASHGPSVRISCNPAWFRTPWSDVAIPLVVPCFFSPLSKPQVPAGGGGPDPKSSSLASSDGGEILVAGRLPASVCWRAGEGVGEHGDKPIKRSRVGCSDGSLQERSLGVCGGYGCSRRLPP